MKRAQKIWDLLFGVALIGGAPISTFYAAVFVLHFANVSRFSGPLVLICTTAAFACACIWRKKHRVLPVSLFATEVSVAVFVSVLFMVVLALAEYAAYGAD
ncbi:MAG: hypothetical protein WCH99_00815 [Verrucomicrobiota bacterium]